MSQATTGDEVQAKSRLNIPDYVTAKNRARLIELSQPYEKEVSDVDCNEYLIRHWLETVEDGNPLYSDRQYARSRGFKDIIAQHSAMQRASHLCALFSNGIQHQRQFPFPHRPLQQRLYRHPRIIGRLPHLTGE